MEIRHYREMDQINDVRGTQDGTTNYSVGGKSSSTHVAASQATYLNNVDSRKAGHNSKSSHLNAPSTAADD